MHALCLFFLPVPAIDCVVEAWGVGVADANFLAHVWHSCIVFFVPFPASDCAV